MGIGTKNHPSQGMEDIRKQADSAMYKDKLITSKNMKIRVIKRILQNIEEHYGREHQHLVRVAQISRAIGQKMGLPPQEVTRLELAASLHDVGKIILDPAILNKPGSLNYLELEQIRRHPDVGYQILKAVDDYAPLAEIVLSHHERLDGNGYPAGLRGDEIPLLSRILAVADSYEAMTAERSYKPTRKPKEAIEELKSLAGNQYDSLVIEALETLVAERKEI
jgi:HD-GYP domain-containing protein (c-di-GMP phosphodiesterase class II)